MTGEVVDVGRNVSRFQVGQRVWANNQGYAGRQGTFAEYCAIHEDLLYPLPSDADPVETVAVLHSALTAVIGLEVKVGLRSDEKLFVNGGDGNVGTAVLEIAKRLGAKVAVTSANEEKAGWCRELGADVVINYKTEDVAEAIRRFAPGGVDVYWDCTRRFDVRRAVEAVAQRGRIIFISGFGQETALPVQPFFLRNLSLFGFTVTDATEQELASYAAKINQLLATESLRGKIARRVSLAHAAEAHQLSESGGLFGKIVLEP
jgi:NADPH2:quinone reductase